LAIAIVLGNWAHVHHDYVVANYMSVGVGLAHPSLFMWQVLSVFLGLAAAGGMVQVFQLIGGTAYGGLLGSAVAGSIIAYFFMSTRLPFDFWHPDDLVRYTINCLFVTSLGGIMQFFSKNKKRWRP
jgi:hypothetical protein